MTIVFLGTGDIGLPTLRALIDAPQHEVAAVFTQPDRPFGRKGELKPPAVKALALRHGIPVHQPERIRSSDSVETLRGYAPDAIVVVAYGQILPKSVLELPEVACLNLHASLLPKHRGAAPVQAPILAGETETGMAVMHMDVGLDTGDVMLVEKIPIAPGETGGSLHDRLAEIGAPALLRALDLLEAGDAPRMPQDHAAATHTGKLDRADGELDWARPAIELERRVRAFHPWPGTTAVFPNGDKVKILPAAVVEAAGDGAPGEVLAADGEGIVVACGEGALRLTQLHPPGRRPMDAAAYLAGHELAPGAVLR